MASISENFAYGSKLRPNQIRLLDPIRLNYNRLEFRSVVVERDNHLKYIAVSYTWGEGRSSEKVFIDGQMFLVRCNLWSCLHYVGKAFKTRLWVDAICINQNDNDEKNNQVSRMDETYRQASGVAVWLGMPRIPISLAHELATRSASELKTLEIGEIFWADHLDDLANRPYWTRVWVIQEFLLNHSVFLFCGNSMMDWQDFKHLLEREVGLGYQLLHTPNEPNETLRGGPNTRLGSKTHHNTNEEHYAAITLTHARRFDKFPQSLRSLHELLL